MGQVVSSVVGRQLRHRRELLRRETGASGSWSFARLGEGRGLLLGPPGGSLAAPPDVPFTHT
jgi:hypothetical protein